LKDLTEKQESSEQVYDGTLLKVYRDVVRLPDGSPGTREYIKHPGAVAIVPLFEDGRVLLERQYRYPHRREFIEVPAGKLDPGEPHLETAKRELLEETGYVAAQWTHVGVIHTAIAYTDEAIEIFLARKLEARERKLDAGEFLDVCSASESELDALARSDAITDAKTLIGLLWLQNWRAGRWTLDWFVAGDTPPRRNEGTPLRGAG
jgi:ADP-ribose pyrophosphatase